jgi:hypothetical protein
MSDALLDVLQSALPVVHESPFHPLEEHGFCAEAPQQSKTDPLSIEDEVL